MDNKRIQSQKSEVEECEKSFGVYAFGFLLILFGGGLNILKDFFFAFPLGMFTLPLVKSSVELVLARKRELQK